MSRSVASLLEIESVFIMDPTKKELYTAKKSSGLNVNADPALDDAIKKLKSDEEPTNWLLMKVSGTNLMLHATGSDGATELISSLNEEDVYYGAIKALVDGKVKFFHIYVVGQNVGGMKKGKASLYKPAALGLVDAHGEFSFVNGAADVTHDAILNEIAKLNKVSKEVIHC
jgi:hypothetical protein